MKVKNRRILHVITGLGDGGAEGALYRFIVQDANNTHLVVSLLNDGKYGEGLRKLNTPVVSLQIDGFLDTIKALKKLRTLIIEFNPIVIQTWMYHADLLGGIAARMSGKKNIFWGVRHSTFSRAGGVKTSHILARINAVLSYIIPRKVICVGHNAKVAHQKMGYSKRKLAVIPNGYDLDKLTPDNHLRSATRQELQVEERLPVLGCVARFNEQKDHATLLEAIRLLTTGTALKYQLLLIGQNMDSENKQLVNLINKKGLQDSVTLLGPRSDIPAIMNAIDIHVLSSAFGEGFPNVIAEAMACGTPCVATNVGDSAHIIRNTGWVVPPSSPEDLAKAISAALTELAEDPQAFEKRKSASRRRILENFSITTMVEKYHHAWFSD